MVVLYADGIVMLRRVATQVRFFILERVGMSTTAVGVIKYVIKSSTQNSDQYLQATNTFQRHPTPPHLPVPSGLSFLERESGDRRGEWVVLSPPN